MNTPYSKDLHLAKKAYQNGDLKTASKHFDKMYETYTKCMSQCGDDSNKRSKVMTNLQNSPIKKCTELQII